jgi:hypothetical protein
MSEWTTPAPLVVDGDSVNAQSVNKSTTVLSERTATLKALIDSISAGQQLVRRNVPVPTDVLSGHVVYFDDDDILHKKALARWADLSSSNVANTPADSSVYAGVVLSKPTATLADVLISGYGVLDGTSETRLFNSVAPAAGQYFLSNSVEGTVTDTKPAMSVRVLEYQAGGVIQVYPPSHEPITHTHLDYTLVTGDWLTAGSFVDAPVGATYGYDFTTANSISINLAEAILPGVGNGIFVGTDGLHQLSSLIYKDDTGIWWTGGGAPAQDYELSVLSADVKGMALLHTILSNTPAGLEVLNNNGRVALALKEYLTEVVTIQEQAVVGIDFENHTLQLGNIINKMVGGAGVTVTSTGAEGSGTATISSSLYNNLPIPAQVLNLNNAVTSVEGAHAITEFPVGRLSQMACNCTLPDLADGTYIARVWVQAISVASNQPAPTCSFSLIPTPAAAGVTPGADTPAVLPNFPAIVSAGDIYYTESGDIALTGAAGGQLNYTLTLDTPADALKIVSTGIILIQQ